MNIIRELNTIEETIAFKKTVDAFGTGETYILRTIDNKVEIYKAKAEADPIILNTKDNKNNQEIVKAITDSKLLGDDFNYVSIQSLLSKSDIANIKELGTTLSGKLTDAGLEMSPYDISDLSCLENFNITDITGFDGSNYKNMFALSSLQAIKLPITLKEIGNSAFAFCIMLRDIKLPRYLTTIKTKSFYNCINLRELTIPAQVTLIERNAFNRCNNLSKIIFKGKPAKIYADTFKGLPENFELYVPSRYYEEYVSEWNKVSDHIKSY